FPHEAVLRERPQVERAVRWRLAEGLAGLGGGERPRDADQVEQRHPHRVCERAYGLRVGEPERLVPGVGRALGFFGTHVSKHYLRKTSFDKSLERFVSRDW